MEETYCPETTKVWADKIVSELVNRKYDPEVQEHARLSFCKALQKESD